MGGEKKKKKPAADNSKLRHKTARFMLDSGDGSPYEAKVNPSPGAEVALVNEWPAGFSSRCKWDAYKTPTEKPWQLFHRTPEREHGFDY